MIYPSEDSPASDTLLSQNEPAVPIKGLRRTYPIYVTMLLFGLVTCSAMIGVPLFGFFHGYTWLDWTMFGLLYVVTGLGQGLFSHCRWLGASEFRPQMGG